MLNSPRLLSRTQFTERWGDHSDAMLSMRAMDVLVNVSTHEGFPLALLETMGLAVPVVAFANGGPADMIEDGVSGFLVPAGDERRLTDRLDMLLRQQPLRERLAREGLDRFHQHYRAEIMAETLHRHLQRAAGPPAA